MLRSARGLVLAQAYPSELRSTAQFERCERKIVYMIWAFAERKRNYRLFNRGRRGRELPTGGDRIARHRHLPYAGSRRCAGLNPRMIEAFDSHRLTSAAPPPLERNLIGAPRNET
jgi:hypothetical protein